MSVDIKLTNRDRKTIAGQFRPSNPAIDAFFRESLDMKVGPVKDIFGNFFELGLNNLSAEIFTKYNQHLLDVGLVWHVTGGPDNVNLLTLSFGSVDPTKYFGGEYLKVMGISDWNSRQVERNEPYSDNANFLSKLYDMVTIANSFKEAFNLHCANHGLYGTNPDVVNNIVTPDVKAPTPDGIIPSLKYNQGFSKYIVELERTEPAFIKAKLGLFLKDIVVMFQEIIIKYNAHLADTSVHDDKDTVNVFTTKPIRKI